MQTWIIVHYLHTMPFSAGAALRTMRSTTSGASIDEAKGLCSWQAPGIRAPARGHSCRPAEAAASCSCCSSAFGRRRRGLPEGTPRLSPPHGNDPLQLGSVGPLPVWMTKSKLCPRRSTGVVQQQPSSTG